MTENYQKQLEQVLARLSAAGRRPRLLLHACCAPCSSYCIDYLCRYFDITLYFYDPNITPPSEYQARLAEVRRLLSQMPLAAPVALQEGPYDPAAFADIARGHEADPEPGERCRRCYRLRLARTARAAAEGGYDWFCTTLSISPHKRADWLNEIGAELGQQYGVPFLPSDFKKRGGYTKSIQFSKEYGLYRQDYCGCVYSAAARHPAPAADPTAKSAVLADSGTAL